MDTVLMSVPDAEVLMALPELYSFGRKGHWFGLKWFTIYMLDAVVQVRLLVIKSLINVDCFLVCHYLFLDFLYV
jgi:hypothetical protein